MVAFLGVSSSSISKLFSFVLSVPFPPLRLFSIFVVEVLRGFSVCLPGLLTCSVLFSLRLGVVSSTRLVLDSSERSRKSFTDGRSSSCLGWSGGLARSDAEEVYENEDAGLNVISSGIFSHQASSVKLNEV